MNRKLLFIDFETVWESKKDGYGLKQMSMIEYIRDPRFKAFGYGWAEMDEKAAWNSGCMGLERFHWKDRALVGHNVKFDAFILSHVYGITFGQYICTKAMSKAVLAKSIKGHSLRDLAEHFGLEAKRQMKTDGLRELTVEQENELADYCVHDVELCREIYTRLAKDFPESQYAPMHRTISMFVEPKLVLNVPLLEKTAKEEAARRENIFKEIGIDKKELASNAKFPKLLESRGYEVPTKTSPRTGKSIPALALGDPEFLEMTETDNEELKALCGARIAAKSTLLETRSAKLAAIGRTGRWPFDVEFSGADQTHRFSGGSGAGGNPQNFTRDSALRDAVEAPKGYSLVVGDFSQVEPRLVAWLARDREQMRLFTESADVYCRFATTYYGRAITKADDFERRLGKEAEIGLGYGMGGEKFQTRIKIKVGKDIGIDRSKEAVKVYRTLHAAVPSLWAKLEEFLPAMTQKGCHISPPGLVVTFGYHCIILPSGLVIRYENLRRREGKWPDGRPKMEWVFDVWKDRKLQTRPIYGGHLLENIAQALGGELTKTAMAHFGDAVTGQMHDEIHVLCKQGLEQVTAQKLKRVMSVAPEWLPELKLDAEVGWGRSWGSAK